MRDLSVRVTGGQARQIQRHRLCQGSATVGVGAGQMSRINSARIAARKAQDAAAELGLGDPLTKGSVVASDAFFPFADGLLVAIEAGATAVIQPGGSMRDDEVITAGDERASRWCSRACGISGIDAFPSPRFSGEKVPSECEADEGLCQV